MSECLRVCLFACVRVYVCMYVFMTAPLSARLRIRSRENVCTRSWRLCGRTSGGGGNQEATNRLGRLSGCCGCDLDEALFLSVSRAYEVIPGRTRLLARTQRRYVRKGTGR